MFREVNKNENSVPYNSLMTEKQAATYIGLSVKTVQRRRKLGQIAFIRDGGIRYRLADLEAYLDERRIPAITPPSPGPKPKYRRASSRSEKSRNALCEFI